MSAPMNPQDFRTLLPAYLAEHARPRHKYGHQARLYALTQQIGAGLAKDGLKYDDDVVFAATWLHDLGVFVGHRPEDPALLTQWDHVAYTTAMAPGLLVSMGFPEEKIAAVLDAIRTHQPHDVPATIEAEILRDADILEQLGAIGVLRTVSKVGNDTRFALFGDARRALQRSLEELPGKIRLEPTRTLAAPRIAILKQFLAAMDDEAEGRLD